MLQSGRRSHPSRNTPSRSVFLCASPPLPPLLFPFWEAETSGGRGLKSDGPFDSIFIECKSKLRPGEMGPKVKVNHQGRG